MRICADHWKQLRQAMVDRGLDGLGAQDAKQAHADMVSDLQSEARAYDPLMDCHWMITSRATKRAGFTFSDHAKMAASIARICEAEAHGVTKGEWIDGPADAVLRHCREKKLVPLPS